MNMQQAEEMVENFTDGKGDNWVSKMCGKSVALLSFKYFWLLVSWHSQTFEVCEVKKNMSSRAVNNR